MSNGTEEIISIYRSRITELEEENRKLEDDFAILYDSQDATVKLLAIANYNKYSLEALSTSISHYTDHIKYLSGISQISDAISLENMSEITEFSFANDEFIENIDIACNYIDSLKSSIASKINSNKSTIEQYQRIIYEIQNDLL